jgi:ppGpp synthetase/RelA/SpoT-type nucleotidyltranferase
MSTSGRSKGKSVSTSRKRVPRTADDFWQRDPALIKRFLDVRRDYEHLCAEVEYILRKLVSANGIETSSISSRAKTLNSFLEKLQRKHYENPFDQLTDLAGVRVVCLYRDDVARVCNIIRSEFAVVEDVDKLDELGVDQFGYGARHLTLRLGKSSSGARYDDLKQYVCEVQVRTVVQDAWAIIQHHMVYKRESQVPSQLQRKLNSLAGLFETVDDQFGRIREDRDAYLNGVRESTSAPATFLETELNLDSFTEYLKWKFPGRPVETWNGQARLILDVLLSAGHKQLKDVDIAINSTKAKRELVLHDLKEEAKIEADEVLASCIDAIIAVGLTAPDWEKDTRWGSWAPIVKRHRGGR